MDSITDKLNELRLKTSIIPMNNDLYDLLNSLINEMININNKIDNKKYIRR